MKFEKFVSLSLCNASIFLIFALIVTSCQKMDYQKVGHFTNIELSGRMPASLENAQLVEQFKNYQDPKQIYLYCALNAPKKDQCYDHHMSKTLSQYFKKHSNLGSDEQMKLKDALSFEKISQNVEYIKNMIVDKLDPQLYQVVLKRVKFCEKNATQNLGRCLKQFKNKDTLAIVNGYQNKHEKLNAHEYLYVQNFIQDILEKRLDFEKDKITNPTKSKVPSYDHKDAQIDTYHL